MANICDNELRVYTEDPENITAITDFFNKNFPHCYIDCVDDENITVYFESRWNFPTEEMNNLIKAIPNIHQLDMTCLSVEWGDYYCEFHTLDDEEWVYKG